MVAMRRIPPPPAPVPIIPGRKPPKPPTAPRRRVAAPKPPKPAPVEPALREFDVHAPFFNDGERRAVLRDWLRLCPAAETTARLSWYTPSGQVYGVTRGQVAAHAQYLPFSQRRVLACLERGLSVTEASRLLHCTEAGYREDEARALDALALAIRDKPPATTSENQS